MFAFFKKIARSVNNAVHVNGNNNHILNIVNTDKTSYSYDPQIDWNVVPQAGAGLSAQLEWRTRLTRIIGRDSEQKALLDWANEAPQLSFKIIEAPGGTGKTRLAAEVAQTLSDTKDWSAGFVQLLDFEKGQRLQWQGNWLTIIDYPEHAPDRLAALFRIAKAGLSQTSAHKLRVLLLCRSQDGIGEKLSNTGVKGYLSSDIKLKELPTQDNFELLTKALAKLMPKKEIFIDKTAFEDWQRQSTLHQTALFVLALALHLSTSPAINQQFLPGKDLLFALVDREKLRWEKAEEGLDLPTGTLADVIAIATLLNGLPAADLNTVLTQHYSWSKPTADKVLTALAEVWHADNSNATVYPALAPDLLAAVFLWDWQNHARKRGNVQDIGLIARLTEDRSAETLSLLHRWHMLSYDQTMRLGLGRQHDIGALCQFLEDIAKSSTTFASQLLYGFNSHSLPWHALNQLVKYCGTPLQQVNSNDPVQLAEHASRLNNQAVRLRQSGDRDAALEMAKDAVSLYRLLAHDNPVIFEPNLAKSLNTLSNTLWDRSDHNGALEAVMEAVRINRRLVKAKPDAFEKDLAVSLNNLAISLSLTNDMVGALAAAKEAVAIRRNLAAVNPTVFEPVLASSLTNIGNRFNQTGDHIGALEASKEAVGIYRRLVKTNPAAFEPELAASLNNLAISLSLTGDYPGALLEAFAAVTIRRRLAAANPAAFEHLLAESSSNLALRLSETGDDLAAYLAAKEALELYESANKRHQGLLDAHIAKTQRLLAHLPLPLKLKMV